MFDIDFHPVIKSTDIDEMRAHYKDYLRFHNYDDDSVDEFINKFDEVDNETRIRWMRGIGVIVEE